MIIGLFKYRIDVFLNQQKYNPAELIFIEGVFLHQYVSIIHQIEGLKIHHNGLKILLVNKKRSFPLGEGVSSPEYYIRKSIIYLLTSPNNKKIHIFS